ncbi:MAG: AraC family transcriptional regulator [Butyricicoccaceae bacterium]
MPTRPKFALLEPPRGGTAAVRDLSAVGRARAERGAHAARADRPHMAAAGARLSARRQGGAARHRRGLRAVRPAGGRPVRPGADYRARRLREIVGYLGEHFTEPLSLPEVASHFGLSPQYFSTFFRENFGRTFTQHINSLRIEQAARLLR